MKKTKCLVLLIITVLALYGCGTRNNIPGTTTNITTNATTNVTTNTTTNTTTKGSKSNTGQPVKYKDGVYDVKHKSTKPGYEEAIVTIKDGKIQNIELRRLDDSQKEINYNDWDGTKNGQPNLKKFRLDLAKAMLDKQSPDVDVITGATQSSNGWKAAVASALSKAQ